MDDAKTRKPHLFIQTINNYLDIGYNSGMVTVGYYDIVTFNGLHHAKYVDNFFKEISRVIK
jgi:hypothetical protein